MAEKFFWADKVAENIIMQRGDKKTYVCASGVTPSGTVHIGNFREVIITDLVVRALKDKKKKVRFIHSWDDYDRFRKVPANVPKNYEKYIGMPLSEIPSPDKSEKEKSYAEHFEKLFENSLKIVGINPEFIYQNKMNKKCAYSSLIKTSLDKKEKIAEILNKYRKEPLAKDWLPIMVYCDKCKKDSTKIIGYKGYEIEYKCACGHKEKFDFRKKGLVSIKWRVDWPLRWKYEKVDFEPGGIDHSVQGGSYTTAKEISKEIFNYNPPIYQFYDWVKIKGGKEFSSSAGNALTIDDVENIYEPEVLRYLFVSQKPKTGFQISFDNDVIKIYDEYDSLEKKYYENKLNPRERRIYEFSQVNHNKIKRKKTKKISFRHLITIVQTGKANSLKSSDKKRAEKVSNWLNKYAGEDMKFSVQEKLNLKEFNKNEKNILLELKKSLNEKKFYTEEELFNEFYNICQNLKVKNTEFFETAYKAIINKKKGPRLASLILDIGQKKIIKLLNQIK